MLKVAVIIDYQNIHLTAHEQFCPRGLPKHQSLIHPLHFANQVVQARASARAARATGSQPIPAISLTRVAVFRGLPSNLHQPDSYRRSLAQQSEWTKDPRVQVNYRTLKYRHAADGRWTAQEKGIDV